MEEQILYESLFSGFYPLTAGNPGAVVALTCLCKDSRFDQEHIHKLCESNVVGSRLHVLFKQCGKQDVNLVLACIEELPTNTDVMERLNEIPTPTLTEEQKDDVIQSFKWMRRLLRFT